MLMSSGNEHQKASARRAERDGMLRPGDIRQYRLRIRGKDREQARE